MRKKPRGRGPVVHLDRIKKARMIEAILSDYLQQPIEQKRILDIGCGNGDISAHFARLNDQYGVDIIDRRKEQCHNFRFSKVEEERLPFKDGYFDIVISHHVIEHVDDQGLHLDEIYRVLKPGGIGYLATPNRSSPIMEGHVGNSQVLRYCNMRPLFNRHGFDCHEYAIKVIREPARFHAEISYLQWIPGMFLRMLRPLFPSHMFIVSRALTPFAAGFE